MLEGLSLFTGIVAVCALLNWAAGSHSFFGRPMEVRTSPFWVACRWLGVGYCLCSILQQGTNSFCEPIVSFVVVLFFAIGCSRRYVPPPELSNHHSRPTAESKATDSQC